MNQKKVSLLTARARKSEKEREREKREAERPNDGALGVEPQGSN